MRTPPLLYNQAGFTLIEALVGLLLVSATVVGVSKLLVLTMASTRVAAEETSAMLLAVGRLEALASALTSGVPPVLSPDDALDVDAAGFSDVVEGNGRAVRADAPPAASVFRRRWRVRPLPAGPAGAWVIQVRVLSVDRTSDLAAAPSAARRPGEVLLTTIRRAP